MKARDTAAVILAAGQGRRLGRGNKALLALAGEPLLAWSLRAFRRCPSVAEITVVMDPADEEDFEQHWRCRPADLGADRVVAGGAVRWESSRLGCEAAAAADLLAVHDAARPLILPAAVEAVLAAARRTGGALAAAPVADTLKRADHHGDAAETVPRQGLWRAQTPQAFRRDALLEAFGRWPQESPPPTDEAMLLEALGRPPALVAVRLNFKVTTPEDLQLAEALLHARKARE